jgi:hypothetical protein
MAISSNERKRAEQEEALDEALRNTFPASDPISMEQPTPPTRSRIDEDLEAG